MLPPPCMTLTTSSSISAAARSGTIGAVRGPSLHQQLATSNQSGIGGFQLAASQKPVKQKPAMARRNGRPVVVGAAAPAGCWLLVGWVVGRWSLAVGRWLLLLPVLLGLMLFWPLK